MARGGGRQKIIRSTRSRKIVRFILLGAILTVFLLGFWWLITRSPFLINSVQIRNNQTIATAELEQFIVHALSGSRWLVFPKKSIFFYPRKELLASLQVAFPRLETVNLALNRAGVLEVTVQEKRAVLLACRPENMEKDKECWFVDRTGKIFQTAPTFTGGVYLKVIRELPAEPIGTALLTDFSNFYRLVQGLEKLLTIELDPPQKLDRGEILADGVIKFWVGSWPIILTENQTADEILLNLETVLRSKQLQGKIDKLEYLDLRYGRKIFYKFR